jgi:hypothetical protein
LAAGSIRGIASRRAQAGHASTSDANTRTVGGGASALNVPAHLRHCTRSPAGALPPGNCNADRHNGQAKSPGAEINVKDCRQDGHATVPRMFGFMMNVDDC